MEVTARSVGIDIGTTSVKCCFLDTTARVLAEKSTVHDAWIKHESHLFHEQDAVKIICIICDLLKSMKVTLSSDVTISVTGQMHGVVLWNGQDLARGKFNCSALITWMDERVPKKFVDSLPRWDCGELHVGFGMVTLAWLHASGHIDAAWNCCGTIMDMLICYLAQREFSVIGIQNAYSWGYCSFDGRWTAPKDLIPAHLLPKICSSEEVVGLVQRDFGLRTGAKLLASCGDLQSTVYPLLEPGTAVLNLGTSAQLCFAPNTDRLAPASLLTVPFFGDSMKKKIVVAASMNGGNAVDLIAKKIVEWASKLTSSASDLQLDYEKLNNILNEPMACSTIKVEPLFIPERAESDTASAIHGINSGTTVEELLHGTACGIVSNLFHLLPPDQLEEWGIKRIRLTGNANRNYFIHEITRQCDGRFQVSTVTDQNCSAAYGTALHALQFSCSK